MFIYKHENGGGLPLAGLKNLLGEEPCRNSRHVTIAISGWMSQDGDSAAEWGQLIEYVKESQSSLFSFIWESKKPWNIAQGIGQSAKIAAKREGRYSMIKLAKQNF